MFKNEKIARTVIADLPETACELSAAELDSVAGGTANISNSGNGVGNTVHVMEGRCGCPVSCTFCDDVDYAK